MHGSWRLYTRPYPDQIYIWIKDRNLFFKFYKDLWSVCLVSWVLTYSNGIFWVEELVPFGYRWGSIVRLQRRLMISIYSFPLMPGYNMFVLQMFVEHLFSEAIDWLLSSKTAWYETCRAAAMSSLDMGLWDGNLLITERILHRKLFRPWTHTHTRWALLLYWCLWLDVLIYVSHLVHQPFICICLNPKGFSFKIIPFKIKACSLNESSLDSKATTVGCCEYLAL